MGRFLEHGVAERFVSPEERDRRCPTRSTVAFWEEMRRPIDEQCLFTLATLEFLQERLFQVMQQSRHR